METRHDFNLHFKSDRGVIKTIRVPNANPDIDGAVLAVAMETIINSGVVVSASGKPSERKMADLITTRFKQFDIV